MFSSLAASDNHVGNSSGVAAGRNEGCPKLRHNAHVGARKENQASSAFLGIYGPRTWQLVDRV